MMILKLLSLLNLLLSICPLLSAESFKEQFANKGYVEICNTMHGTDAFDLLYARFDAMIEFLQTHPAYAQKFYIAKERFIRSRDKSFYSTDFFGFYDESDREGRNQLSFYYSTHYHEFIVTQYPEINEIPVIKNFLEACREIQEPYGWIFKEAAKDLDVEAVFASRYDKPPILLKVIKYLPSYAPSKPHYDGTALTLFLDSTDNESLLLSPYKPTLIKKDFAQPARIFSRSNNHNSLMLIPGILLSEYSIYPTPHIVLQSGTIRYAAIAFAMRPNYSPKKVEFASLPNFKH